MLVIIVLLGEFLVFFIAGICIPFLAFVAEKIGIYIDKTEEKKSKQKASWPPPINRDWHSQWKRF